MTHKISTIILAAITALFIGVMIYNGLPATLDDIATWRNGGLTAEDARCAAAFKMELE